MEDEKERKQKTCDSKDGLPEKLVVDASDDIPDTKKHEEETGRGSKHPRHGVRLLKTLRQAGAWFERHVGAMTALATVLIAMLTAVYVRYSWKQWDVMRRQLSAFEVVESAHLGIARLEVDFADRSGGAVRIWLGNYGHTPSPEVTVFTHAVVVRPGPITEKDHAFEIGKAEIAPGDDRFPVRIPLEFAAEELRSVQDGQSGLLFSGMIRFGDGFGRTKETGFCHFFEAKHPESWGRCTPKLNYTSRKDLERQVEEIQREQQKAGSQQKP